MGRHRLLVVIAAAMFLCAGCFSGGGPQETRSPQMTSTDSPTMTPVETDASTHSTDAAACPNFISFGEITADIVGWGPGIVRISYTIPAKSELLFVVYENETILGTDRKRHPRDFAMDGWPIQLDEPLDGPHTVRVITYTDTNGDGSIDPTTDEPCRRNGSIIEAGPITLDFGDSRNESTTLVTTDSPT